MPSSASSSEMWFFSRRSPSDEVRGCADVSAGAVPLDDSVDCEGEDEGAAPPDTDDGGVFCPFVSSAVVEGVPVPTGAEASPALSSGAEGLLSCSVAEVPSCVEVGVADDELDGSAPALPS